MAYAAGEFAQRLRSLRETHGLSVRALAERVGVSKVTLWKWERGENQPRERHLIPLATALNVNPDELRASIGRYERQRPHDQQIGQAEPHSAASAQIDLNAGAEAQELSAVIARAKRMIAEASGVGTNNISITIEY